MLPLTAREVGTALGYPSLDTATLRPLPPELHCVAGPRPHPGHHLFESDQDSVIVEYRGATQKPAGDAPSLALARESAFKLRCWDAELPMLEPGAADAAWHHGAVLTSSDEPDALPWEIVTRKLFVAYAAEPLRAPEAADAAEVRSVLSQVGGVGHYLDLAADKWGPFALPVSPRSHTSWWAHMADLADTYRIGGTWSAVLREKADVLEFIRESLPLHGTTGERRIALSNLTPATVALTRHGSIRVLDWRHLQVSTPEDSARLKQAWVAWATRDATLDSDEAVKILNSGRSGAERATRGLQWREPYAGDHESELALQRMAAVIAAAVTGDPQQRPSSADVLRELRNVLQLGKARESAKRRGTIRPPRPKSPAYTAGRGPAGVAASRKSGPARSQGAE